MVPPCAPPPRNQGGARAPSAPTVPTPMPNPPLLAYRCPPNLKYLLVRAAYGQVKEAYMGNSQCQQPRCKTYTHIHVKIGLTLHSAMTGEVFKIKATANCCTKNVVYVIECKKCTTQYI